MNWLLIESLLATLFLYIKYTLDYKGFTGLSNVINLYGTAIPN